MKAAWLPIGLVAVMALLWWVAASGPDARAGNERRNDEAPSAGRSSGFETSAADSFGSTPVVSVVRAPVMGEEPRVLSGVVYDDGEPLRTGGVYAHRLGPTTREKPIRVPIGSNGEFRIALKPEEFPGSMSRVSVIAGATLFSGMVRIGEDLQIHVSSAAVSDGMAGRIELPGLKREARWFARLLHPNHERPEIVAVAAEAGGPADDVRFEYTQPQYASLSGAVVLVITAKDPRQGTLAHTTFGDLHEFKEALHAGITIRAAQREFIVPPAPVIDGLYLSAKGIARMQYATTPHESLRFVARIPAGSYAVFGTTGRQTLAAGTLEVTADARYHIEWREELPGPHSLDVSVTDASGDLVTEGVSLARYLIRDDGITDFGTVQPEEGGAFRLCDLLAGTYRLMLWRNGMIRRKVDVEVPRREPVTIELGETCAVVLDIQDSNALGLDVVSYTDTRVWFRRTGEPWVALDTPESRKFGGWVVRQLDKGELHGFAIQGSFWAGATTVDLVGDLSVSIPVRATADVSFCVSTAGGEPAVGAKLKLGNSDMPWSGSTVNGDGVASAQVLEGAMLPEFVVVEYGGRKSRVLFPDAQNTRGEWIVVLEAE